MSLISYDLKFSEGQQFVFGSQYCFSALNKNQQFEPRYQTFGEVPPNFIGKDPTKINFFGPFPSLDSWNSFVLRPTGALCELNLWLVHPSDTSNRKPLSSETIKDLCTLLVSTLGICEYHESSTGIPKFRIGATGENAHSDIFSWKVFLVRRCLENVFPKNYFKDALKYVYHFKEPSPAIALSWWLLVQSYSVPHWLYTPIETSKLPPFNLTKGFVGKVFRPSDCPTFLKNTKETCK